MTTKFHSWVYIQKKQNKTTNSERYMQTNIFKKNKFIYLFIFGCVGSLLLLVGFL